MHGLCEEASVEVESGINRVGDFHRSGALTLFLVRHLVPRRAHNHPLPRTSSPHFGKLTAILAVTSDSSRMAFSASAWRSSNENP